MLNRAQLQGNIGKAPEIVTTTSGHYVAKMSIATSKRWRDKDTGEQKEKTEWHRVVCWGEGLCKYIQDRVTKGTPVYVEGELQTREWEDEQGVKRWSTEVVVQGFGGVFIAFEKRPNTHREGPPLDDSMPPEGPSRQEPSRDHFDDHIPF